MKRVLRSLAVGTVLASCHLALASEESFLGDHRIAADPGASPAEAGNLTVEGAFFVDGNEMQLGATAALNPALAITYVENGTTYELFLTADRSAAAYLWQDNGGSTAKNKMKLDASNVLSLYNSAGSAAGITLNPNTGDISLSSGGALVLSDGKRIGTKADLSTLYDSAGNAKLSIDGSGNLIVSAPATFQQLVKADGGIEFAPGVALDSGNTTYLKDVLHNLGYRDGGDPVADKMLPIYGATIAQTAYDTSGNLYVTGTLGTTTRFGATTLSGGGAFVAKVNSSGAFVWIKQLGGAVAGAAVAVDGSGNVYGAGTFSSNVTFSPAPSLTHAGSGDVFIVKLSSTGSVTWAKGFGGTATDVAAAVGVDGSGNVFCVGKFNGSTNFGGTAMISAGDDVFVMKLDSTGAMSWVKEFGGSSTDTAADLVLDGSGNVFCVGSFNGNASYDGASVLTSAGSSDAFILKVNSSGALTWAKRLGGTGADGGNGLGLDGSGPVYVTGSFSGSVTFATTPTTIALTSAGGTDVFVAKLDGASDVTWATKLGGTGSENVNGLAVDGSGNSFCIGSFSGTANFGAQPALISAGGADLFVAKLDAAGDVSWASQAGSAGSESAKDIAIESGGAMALAASFGGNTRIGDQVAPAMNAVYVWPGGAIPVDGVSPGKFAWGDSVASSTGSVALGKTSAAGGEGSFAAGNSAAVGRYSASFGGGIAVGDQSTASGGGVATGEGSVAMGYGAKATNFAATALATGQATGWFAVAIGTGATASGSSSIALGSSTHASGDAATAMGSMTTASGSAATAMGAGTVASGSQSTAMGAGTTASGGYATSMGVGTQAVGMASTATGYFTQATANYSFSMGVNSIAGGDFSIATGIDSRASALEVLALGQFNVGGYYDNQDGNPNNDGNKQWIASDPLLEVGDGTSPSARSNALTLFKNGKLRVTNTVESRQGFRTPPMGDLSMGDFTAGENPEDLNPATGLKYPGE